ncbi:MAG: vitamin K epoxide reductase family protein [Chloroflexi bacterium]|nr:vitamin K epoxide reductase family protein [Chloroflexota bacterium]
MVLHTSLGANLLMVVSRKKNTINWIPFILVIVGLIDSVYLAWLKFANATAACGNIGDCESVNSSPYAEVAGIPIALFGAGAYFIMLLLLILEPRNKFWGANATLGLFGISLVGVLYSAYLTYVEIAILHAICPYCVLSAVVLVILLAISIKKLLADLENPDAE